MSTMMQRRAEAIAKSAKGVIDAKPGLDERLRHEAVAQLQRENDRLIRENENLRRVKAGLSDEIAATRAAANLEAAETKTIANTYLLEKRSEADRILADAKVHHDETKRARDIAINTCISALRKPMRQAFTDATNECKRIVDHFFDGYDGGAA